MLVCILQGEGHVEIAVDGLNSERRVAQRQLSVGKILYPLEIRVVHLDPATVEIGGINESAIRGCADGQTLVNRSASRVVNGKDGVVQVHARTPSADGPTFRVEDENGTAGHIVCLDVEGSA